MAEAATPVVAEGILARRVVRGGGGGHFSAARVSGGRIGTSRVGAAQIRSSHVRSFSRTRTGTSRSNFARVNGAQRSNLARVNGAQRGNFARVNGAQVRGLGAGTLGGRAAWNHWGNSTGAAAGTADGAAGPGPVFWPFFYGDLFALCAVAVGLFTTHSGPTEISSCGMPCSGPVLSTPTAQYDDVYGGYAYGGPARSRTARRVAPETTGSVTDSADLAQSCGGLAPGVTDLPIDSIQQSIQLTDDQLRSLNALKAASSQASEVLKASCSSELSVTPLGRLDTVQKRLDGMVQGWGMIRTPLDDFYNSLNNEQKQRFAALGRPSGARSDRRGSATGDNLAALCSSRTENFTQLPVQRVEQAVKPTEQQQDALEKLKAASTEAASQLQASCPAQSPQTPLDRFEAVGKRLDAMAAAIKTVRPALADFYSSLTDEQKARFNTLGPPQSLPHPG